MYKIVFESLFDNLKNKSKCINFKILAIFLNHYDF